MRSGSQTNGSMVFELIALLHVCGTDIFDLFIKLIVIPGKSPKFINDFLNNFEYRLLISSQQEIKKKNFSHKIKHEKNTLIWFIMILKCK